MNKFPTFKHIDFIKCPVCKADIKHAEITGVHTNGEQFESIEFHCGYRTQYVPNFSRFSLIHDCCHSTKSKQHDIAVNSMYDSLIQIIFENNNDLPNAELVNLTNRLKEWVQQTKRA